MKEAMLWIGMVAVWSISKVFVGMVFEEYCVIVFIMLSGGNCEKKKEKKQGRIVGKKLTGSWYMKEKKK